MILICRWTLCVISLCLASTAVTRAQRVMTDPLIGISYDREAVRFERMPPRLIKRCSRLNRRYVAAWVYGYLQTPDSEYFLISGLMDFRADGPGGARTVAPEEGGGLIVTVRGSECLVDQADYFLTQGVNPAKSATPIMVPKSILTGILQDAFERYATAFGGRQEFLNRVKPIKPNALLPVVREQLEVFENEHAK